MSERPICENCLYFQGNECHRFPPSSYQGFPKPIGPLRWCGEHMFITEEHRGSLADILRLAEQLVHQEEKKDEP